MVAGNIKEIRIIDLCNQVSETTSADNNILSERRYSDRSSKCLGRLYYRNVLHKMYTNSNIEVYITLYTLCTFMKYTFCSIQLELKCIQKVHIFVHFV